MKNWFLRWTGFAETDGCEGEENIFDAVAWVPVNFPKLFTGAGNFFETCKVAEPFDGVARGAGDGFWGKYFPIVEGFPNINTAKS